MRKLLVTGFGPFPRVPRNPSEGLARAVVKDPRWRRLGVAVEALVLETRYSAIDTHLIPKIREFRPDAILMLGVAGRRRHVSIEMRASNRVSRLMPDAGGSTTQNFVYRPGAAQALRSHAPLAPMMRVMHRRGVDARLSRDAGRYLCNAAYFAALEEAARGSRIPVVFVHIPMQRKIMQPKRALQLKYGSSSVGRREVTGGHLLDFGRIQKAVVEGGFILFMNV